MTMTVTAGYAQHTTRDQILRNKSNPRIAHHTAQAVCSEGIAAKGFGALVADWADTPVARATST